MYKFVLFFICFIQCSYGISQVTPGFNPSEAKDLLAICNSFTYLDNDQSDAFIIPSAYKKIYTSPVYGMDNKFQVYVKDKIGVINFRGSTDQKSSWLENMYSSMIPVKDEIILNNQAFKYQVGIDTAGGVHAGYVLAISYLEADLLRQLKALNEKGIYSFFITGHSQGGALAQIFRAYVEYLPASKVSKRNVYKVYAFANPMIGNQEFANEYSAKFCKTEMSFLIHNPEDIVPRMPMSYNDSTYWKSNLQTALFDKEHFSIKQMLAQGAMNAFENPLNKTSNFLARNVNKQISKDLGTIEMPVFKKDINYTHTSAPLYIPPTVYPLALKDSSILENDSLMRIYKRDANGVFEDKSLYEKDKVILQHKPYNYYTAFLKIYFPSEYGALKEKFFIAPKEE